VGTVGDAYTRVTTVRITEEQAVKVERVARVLGCSTSDLIRTAIAEYLALAVLDDEGIRR
jgi:predicted transcriptional regulator